MKEEIRHEEPPFTLSPMPRFFCIWALEPGHSARGSISAAISGMECERCDRQWGGGSVFAVPPDHTKTSELQRAEGRGQLPQSAVPITHDPSIQVSWKRASGSGAVGMP